MTKVYPCTLVLLGLNILVFLWLAVQQQSLMMNDHSDVLAILHAGANFNPFTLGGEPWRIISSMFLHFGIIHLLINMASLYTLGSALEKELGATRFLLVYFFCGVVAGIVSLVFNVYTISAGASGALFGLYGYSLGSELVKNYNDRTRLINVLVNFLIFLAVSFYFTTVFRVDTPGHIGGCIAGLILSVVHYKFQWLTENKGLAAALVIISFSLFLIPKDLLNYYRIFHRVLQAERLTNQMYDQSNDDMQLKDSLITLIPRWDSIYSSLGSLRRVPEPLRQDTSTMKKYITLRKQDATFRIALIEKESYAYLDSLEIVNAGLDSLPPFKFILNFDPSDTELKPDTARTTPDLALETKRIFYDANWKQTDDPSASVYYRIGTVDSLDRWQGKVTDYYRNGDIQMKGGYLNDMKNGVFIYYSKEGRYSSSGRYMKEDAVGKWENYHWNGALQSEVYYNDAAFTRNVWDSLGRAQVVNGNGRSVSWHSNGQVSQEGNYLNGRREGDWYGYHDDGKPYYHEVYRDNRLIRGAAEDKEGKRYVYDQLSLYPFPVIGMTEYKKYLERTMRRSDLPASTTGVVKVIFDVGVDGSIWDFVVIQSLSPEHDREAVRLIEAGPAWRPGLLHGHVKLPSQGYVEVVF